MQSACLDPNPWTLTLNFTFWFTQVAYTGLAGGAMRVCLSLPTVEAADLRPGVRQQQRSVVSSGDGASFLTLQYGGGGPGNKQVRQTFKIAVS